MTYTRSERTDKKYTIGQALESAKRRLNRIGIARYCVNAIQGRDAGEKITLEELNTLADSIYDDSVYYGENI